MCKTRMLELYYNFFDKFCDISNFEEIGLDTVSLYLALAEQELTDCIRSEVKTEWQKGRSIDCDDSFAAVLPPSLLRETQKTSQEGAGSLQKKNSGIRKCCVFLVTYCLYDTTSSKINFSSNFHKKRVLEQSGDGPL